MPAEHPAACACDGECPCHTKGDAFQGYVYHYTDDRDILHEDWVSCRCTPSAASASRRWLWRHPHRAIWRSLVHWRHAGEPPWRQTATALVFFNPRPLDAALRAGLLTKEPE